MRRGKKILCVLLIVIISSLCTLTSFASIISWDNDDLQEEYVTSLSDFSSKPSGFWASGTEGTDYRLDSEKFASDKVYESVLYLNSSKSMNFNDSNLANYLSKVNGQTKVRITFDYWLAEGADTKIYPNIGNIKANDTTVLGSDTEAYWESGKDHYRQAVKGNGKWNSFDGVLDVSSYVAAEAIGAVDFSQTKLSFQSIGSEIYLDNFKVSIIYEPIPLIQPEIENKWTKVDDEDDHTNVYKNTITVNKSQTENIAITGVAPGFFKTGDTYEISFSFKEDASNKYRMTRMWRFCSVYDEIKYNKAIKYIEGDHLYYYGNYPSYTKGNWQTISKKFTVGTHDNTADLTGLGGFTLYWESGSENDLYKTEGDIDKSGNYTIYIADVSIRRVPAVSPNSITVSTEEMQNVGLGENLSIAVDGYIDINTVPMVTLNGIEYIGKWENIVTSGKRTQANAVFDSVNTVAISTAQESGNLVVTDIWGRENLNPITVSFTKAVSNEVEVLRGDWVDIYRNTEEIAVTSDTNIIENISMKDNFENGNALIKFSFTAKGDSSKDYKQKQSVAFRTGGAEEVGVEVPCDDLKTGISHNYETIVDLGAMDRYYGNTDRVNSAYWIRLRAYEYGVTYSNIIVQKFVPSESGQFVAARLKVTNNADIRFSPDGVFIFAKYNKGDQLLGNIQYKDIKYKDEGILNNALGKGESKFIYLTLNDNAIEDYSQDNKYKAFYWNSFGDMKPQANKAEK